MDNQELILTFEINGSIWKIYDVDNIDLVDNTENILGLTLYPQAIVYIQRGSQKARELLSLKHELTHVWMYEYGHNQQDEDKTFNNEDVCEIVACSNNWINEIVKQYEKAKANNKKS